MLRYCADRDVKVVAKELLYIASAPKLKLGQDDFVAWRESANTVSESFSRKKYKSLNKPKAPYKYVRFHSTKLIAQYASSLNQAFCTVLMSLLL
jgi:hypothetical protein